MISVLITPNDGLKILETACLLAASEELQGVTSLLRPPVNFTLQTNTSTLRKRILILATWTPLTLIFMLLTDSEMRSRKCGAKRKRNTSNLLNT